MSVGKKKRSFLVLAQSMLLSQILVLHQRMNFVRDAVLDSTTKSWSRRRAKNVRRRPVSLFLVCIFKKFKEDGCYTVSSRRGVQGTLQQSGNTSRPKDHFRAYAGLH